jgi:hypothetical protein
MKPKARHLKTPVGKMPLHPAHSEKIEQMEDKYDLFRNVENNGFIDPVYFQEVLAQDLYAEYEEWKRGGPSSGNRNPVNHLIDKIVND